MTAIDILFRLLLFLVLCLAQALVFNQIHLFGVATPLLYVYFVVMLPRGFPKWAGLLWSFFLGLSVDMFSNTPGVAAASMTLIAMLQPYLLELFVPRDSADDLKCSAATLGTGKFATFAVIQVLLYCIVFFTLEMFTFFNWLQWLECIGGSALITLILILTLETIRK